MSRRLLNRGYLALLITQFFGAANDNVLKGVLIYMVVDGAWQGRLGEGGQGIVSLCFTLPFVILSGYAGQFADRRSKRQVSVLVKIAEIPIAIVAFLGFLAGNLWVTLGGLVLLTCQSAFFGPAKYGMIPELVHDEELSRANGLINMMTNIAVIAGTLAAGFLADAYNPLPALRGATPPPALWAPGAAMVIVAFAGLLAVIFLPRLEPGDRALRYTWNPFATYVQAVGEMARSPLLTVALAWGYFYLLAGIGLLIVPEYTVVLKSWGVNRAEASILLGVMAVAIGIGSVAAGLISGRRIEPRLIPIGALGITVFFILLGTVPPTVPAMAPNLRIVLSGVSGLIFGAGFFAGFYIVPLQAMLQKLSPDDERGRFLGTANAISFAFLSLASLIYWVIRGWFGNEPQRIFLVCAGLMILGGAFFLLRLRRSRLRHGRVGTRDEYYPDHPSRESDQSDD